MKKEISKIDILHYEDKIPKDAIGKDIIMFDDISMVPFFDYPTKIDIVVTTLCKKGRIKGSINLKESNFSANDLIVLLPNQIIQYFYVSDDFSGQFIVMSKRLIDSFELNIKDSISVFLHLKENPVIHLRPDEMEHLSEYFSILKKAVRMVDNPYRLEMAKSLIQAFFYGMNNFSILIQEKSKKKSKKEVLFESFYNLILDYYKESREVGFYAEKLCLTPKYLSTVIKDTTGKSAFDWINDYVILEAKSMLKSTGMNIQEISYQLNFPSQSFFGQYFKRLTGITPSKYRSN